MACVKRIRTELVWGWRGRVRGIIAFAAHAPRCEARGRCSHARAAVVTVAVAVEFSARPAMRGGGAADCMPNQPLQRCVSAGVALFLEVQHCMPACVLPPTNHNALQPEAAGRVRSEALGVSVHAGAGCGHQGLVLGPLGGHEVVELLGRGGHGFGHQGVKARLGLGRA